MYQGIHLKLEIIICFVPSKGYFQLYRSTFPMSIQAQQQKYCLPIFDKELHKESQQNTLHNQIMGKNLIVAYIFYPFFISWAKSLPV